MEEGWGAEKRAKDGASEQVARYWPPHTYEESLCLFHASICLHLCVIFRIMSPFFPFFYITFLHSLVQRCEYIWDLTLESCSREYFSQVENYIESDCPRIIFNVASNSWEQLRRISLSNYIRIVMISMKITVKDNYLGMSFVFFLLFL